MRSFSIIVETRFKPHPTGERSVPGGHYIASLHILRLTQPTDFKTQRRKGSNYLRLSNKKANFKSNPPQVI
jgi:hypothetical protein